MPSIVKQVYDQSFPTIICSFTSHPIGTPNGDPLGPTGYDIISYVNLARLIVLDRVESVCFQGVHIIFLDLVHSFKYFADIVIGVDIATIQGVCLILSNEGSEERNLPRCEVHHRPHPQSNVFLQTG